MVNRCIFFIAAAFLLVLSACGGGSDGHDAPFDSSITTDRSSISWTCADDEDPATNDTGVLTDTLTIFVKNENGIPLRDVGLNIFFPLAVPNANLVQLYDGDPGHGASPKDSPLSVKTDENGAYTLYFQFLCGGGVEFTADFQISSGSLSTLVTLDVAAEAL